MPACRLHSEGPSLSAILKNSVPPEGKVKLFAKFPDRGLPLICAPCRPFARGSRTPENATDAFPVQGRQEKQKNNPFCFNLLQIIPVPETPGEALRPKTNVRRCRQPVFRPLTQQGRETFPQGGRFPGPVAHGRHVSVGAPRNPPCRLRSPARLVVRSFLY